MSDTIENMEKRIEEIREFIRTMDRDTPLDQVWEWYEEIDELYEKIWRIKKEEVEIV